MEHPALQNKVLLAFYILLWTIVSLAVAFVIAPFLALPFELCLLFGAIVGYLFGAMSFALWSVVKYADYSSLKWPQSAISYIALALVSVGMWLGVSWFLLYLSLPETILVNFVPLIPLEILLGICFFIIVVLIYNSLLTKQKESEKEEELEEIEQVVEQQQPEEAPRELLERVAVKVGSKIQVVLVSDILVIQAEGDYVLIHTATGHHMKEQTMRYFEENLSKSQFVRVHRSYIVNVEAISRIELFEKQNQLVTLQGGMQIKVSATGYKQLKKTLDL